MLIFFTRTCSVSPCEPVNERGFSLLFVSSPAFWPCFLYVRPLRNPTVRAKRQNKTLIVNGAHRTCPHFFRVFPLKKTAWTFRAEPPGVYLRRCLVISYSSFDMVYILTWLGSGPTQSILPRFSRETFYRHSLLPIEPARSEKNSCFHAIYLVYTWYIVRTHLTVVIVPLEGLPDVVVGHTLLPLAPVLQLAAGKQKKLDT